jgi:adenylate cyclase
MPRAPPVIATVRPAIGRSGWRRRMAREGTFRPTMDWEADGLLDGIADADARAARRALLDELHEQGVPLEELRRAAAEDRLALLPVERVLTSEPRWTAREVSERSGMDLGFFEASRRALGLPWPDPDARLFGDDDVESATLGQRYREAGFPDAEAIEVTRVLGQGMARYAEATRTMAAHAFLEKGIDERELAHRYRGVAEALLPLTGPWLRHVFNLHLREVLRQDAITREQLETGRVQDARPMAVAFADLVGFTSLGETVELEELTGVAARLTALTADVIGPPVHLVKQIGDAVMLVSTEVPAMIDATLDLVAAADGDDSFPPVRAGVAYGPAINRWGDWYGSTVNVASRLTARARPASVLVTENVRREAGDRYAWSAAGPKKLKGLSAPVRTYRVRRDGGA